jgi:hypothetical protein
LTETPKWGFFPSPAATQIIDTIEYKPGAPDEVSLDELDLLEETPDALIDHVERLKQRPPP